MTREVTDTLYRTDGEPWAAAPVTFQRTSGSFEDASSWPPDTTQATTDAAGAYSVQLWPDAAGLIRSRYLVSYPNGDKFRVSIPDGTTPISMPEVRAATVGPPVPPSALDAHEAAPDPHAQYLLPAEADLLYAPLIHTQAWSTITTTPMTLAGYGITDAYTKAEADASRALKANLTGGNSFTGQQVIQTGTTGNKGLVIQLAAGQAVNALEVLDSTSAVLVAVRLDGRLSVPTLMVGSAVASAAGQIHLGGTNPSVYYDRSGVTEWILYQPSNATLAVRDVVNAKMLVVFSPGAAGLSSTVVSDKLLVRAGAAQATTMQEWQDSTSAVLASVAAGGLFSVQTLDAGTVNAAPGLRVRHNTSGAPAVGFGAALEFQLKSSTTVDQPAGSIAAVWGDPTHATRTAALAFQTVNSGTQAEKLRITGSGNLGINTSTQFGSGVGVVALANAGTIPSTNPTGGGVLYAEAGSLKWRNPAGVVTVIAP